jgi:hypothetical protein
MSLPAPLSSRGSVKATVAARLAAALQQREQPIGRFFPRRLVGRCGNVFQDLVQARPFPIEFIEDGSLQVPGWHLRAGYRITWQIFRGLLPEFKTGIDRR